jgi:putative sterol carrier protein
MIWMSLEEATTLARKHVGDTIGIAKTLKVNLGDDGVIYFDGRSTPNIVSNEDAEADVTLTCSMKTFLGLLEGDVNPQMAYMMGKIKISGDMGLALAFAKALG